MLRILLTACFAAGSLLLAAGGTQAQDGPLTLVNHNAVCYVAIERGGDQQLIPCSVADDYRDDITVAQWRRFCLDNYQKLSLNDVVKYCERYYSEPPPAEPALFGSPALINSPSGSSSDYQPDIISNIRISANPAYRLQAPQWRGLLATETSGIITNPAFSTRLTYSGTGIDFSVGETLYVPVFGAPIEMDTRFSIGRLSATRSGGGIALPEGMGVTSVGETPGVYVNSPTDVDRYDFDSTRGFASVESVFGYKLIDLQPAPHLAVGISAAIGVRGNAFQQAEETYIETTTPAFGANAASTIRYKTDFAGAGIGLVAGLKFDGSYDLGARSGGSSADGLKLTKSLGAYFGYDAYTIDVHDRVDAQILNGLATHVSDNEFTVGGGVPVARLDGQLGIGTDRWQAYVGGSIGTGAQPYIDYARPDSTTGGTPLEPTLTITGSVTYQYEIGVKAKF